MAKPQRRRTRKRQSEGREGREVRERAPRTSDDEAVSPEELSGGGLMQGIRAGFQRAAGAGEASEKEKPSTLSNVLWTVVLLAAAAFALYRWYG